MTKDEIFAAMEKAYTGAGSTVEGSFAGDLLRACADGCAELWSTEIDGLEERAFVASAAVKSTPVLSTAFLNWRNCLMQSRVILVSFRF